jgi:pseudouridine-5'-phosphate glycosidase
MPLAAEIPGGPPRPVLRVRPEIAAAVAAGRPVVALESTLIAHGLPRPGNLAVARELEELVAAAGALPATVAVLDGVAVVGLAPEELERVAAGEGIAKLGVRDLAPAIASGTDGATTVGSTAVLAARAGIGVFATGGLGGVHREARDTWDESADLHALSRTPMTVVCAGVKSILDVGATLERLESLNVTVVGYRTSAFPGFYLSDSGHPLDWRLDSAAEIAAVLEARARLGLDSSALIVANPLPPSEQLDPLLHDRVLADGLARLRSEGVTGKDVTPFLLAHLHAETQGASLEVNIRLVRRNAELAAEIAVARWRRAAALA